MFPLLFTCVTGLYFAGLFFFTWAQDLKLHDALDGELGAGVDDDFYFWWLWAFLNYIAYPIGVGVYFCVKGVVLLITSCRDEEA